MSKVVEVSAKLSGDFLGVTHDLWEGTAGALWDSLTDDDTDNATLGKGLQKGLDQPRRITLGRDRVGGVIAHQAEVTRDDKKYIQLIVLISGEPIDKLVDIFVADKNIKTYPSTAWSYSLSDGRHTTANAEAVSKMSGWTTQHVGYRQAHVFLEFENNREVFPDGIGDCQFEIKGARVWDPRDANQLPDDEATWQWSDNAVLNTLHYVRFLGAHPVPHDRLPLNWWIAAINVCDEDAVFTDSKGVSKSEKRYTVNGSFQFTSNPLAVLSQLERCFAGKVFRQMGQWFVRVGAWYGEPTYTINQKDVHGNIKIKWYADLRERANIVRATFTDPKQSYERTDAPPVISSRYQLNDNQPLEKSITLPFVHSSTTAQRLAVITLEQTRLGSIEIPLKHSGLEAAAGRTIYVNLPDEAIINKIYRVTNRRFRLDGGVTITAIEDSPALWDDNVVPKEEDLTPNANFSTQPLEAVQAISVNVSRENIVSVSWTHPTPDAINEYNVLVLLEGSEVFETSVSQSTIELPAIHSGDYQVEVIAKNIFGESSRRGVAFFSVKSPVTPQLSVSDVTNTSVVLNAYITSIGLGTVFVWQFLGKPNELIPSDDVASIRGDSFSYQGLQPDTTYLFQCQTINVTGKSPWKQIEVKTKSNQEIFDEQELTIDQRHFAKQTQDIIESIPKIQTTLNDTLQKFSINNSSVSQLKASFNKMGLDITKSQADLSGDFTNVLEQFSDTNKFVFEISETLGTLLVEGNKVSFDKFNAYQLKVDAFEGELSSLSEKTISLESGLSQNRTLLEQNSESLRLLVGNTQFSDTLATVKESAVQLSNVENSITNQSLSAKAKDLATLESLLQNEISALELIESDIDIAISNEKRQASISELEAKSNASELVIASLNKQIAAYSRETKSLSNNAVTLAQRSESLEAKVNLKDGETVSSVATSIARAQVSYCSIGRDENGSPIENPIDCRKVGGTWIEDSPISELLHAAKVTNQKGESVSALSYLTALEDENGQLKARAFFGIDKNGKSGLLVYNTGSGQYERTVLDLAADDILFRARDGAPAVRVNSATGRLEVIGEIVATKLTLADGTVYNKDELKGDKGDSVKGDKGDKGDSVKGDKGDKGDSVKGDKGDKGLLPAPDATPGLFADTQKLGFHNGGVWKTYIDRLGNFFAGASNDNGYIRWYEQLKKLVIKGEIHATSGTFDHVVISSNCEVKGDISGASGKFRGPVLAEKIEGDLVDGDTLSIPAERAQALIGDSKMLRSFRVDKNPKFPCVFSLITGNGSGFSSSYTGGDNSGAKVPVSFAIGTSSSTPPTMTSVAKIPQGTGTVTLYLWVFAGEPLKDRQSWFIPNQTIPALLYREGSGDFIS